MRAATELRNSERQLIVAGFAVSASPRWPPCTKFIVKEPLFGAVANRLRGIVWRYGLVKADDAELFSHVTGVDLLW